MAKNQKHMLALGRKTGNAVITAQPNKNGTVRLTYSRTVSAEEARAFWAKQRDLELTTPLAD
jgi:hypothetical protein